MKLEQIAFNRGYRVTETGTLISSTGKIIQSDKRRYITASFKINGKVHTFYAHRLQAFQKYGMALYDEGIECRHLDNDGLNNSWENIVLGTHSENMLDVPAQVRIKRTLQGSDGRVKHNRQEIKRYHLVTRSYKKTMEKFGISSSGTLHSILKS